MRASSTSTPARARRSWISFFRWSATTCVVPRSEMRRVVVRVVGIARRQVAQRRLALHLHVVVVVVDFEHGFGGVDDLPHDDRGDLDRVALVVVDLQLRRSRSCAPAATRASSCRGDWPSAGRLARGADVVAEQLQHLRLVGVDDEEPGHAGRSRADADASDDERRSAEAAAGIVGVADAVDESPDRRPMASRSTSRTGRSRQGVDLAFADHGCQPPQNAIAK